MMMMMMMMMMIMFTLMFHLEQSITLQVSEKESFI